MALSTKTRLQRRKHTHTHSDTLRYTQTACKPSSPSGERSRITWTCQFVQDWQGFRRDGDGTGMDPTLERPTSTSEEETAHLEKKIIFSSTFQCISVSPFKTGPRLTVLSALLLLVLAKTSHTLV